MPRGQSHTVLVRDNRQRWLQLPLFMWQGWGLIRFGVTEVMCMFSVSSGISKNQSFVCVFVSRAGFFVLFGRLYLK